MPEFLLAQTNLDWFTTITALVYVILAARNNPWCWLFGAVASATWAYVDIVQYQLYSDAGLQVFYVIMAGVGLYQWQLGGEEQQNLEIQRMSTRDHLILIFGATVAGLLLGYLVGEYLPAAATYWDSMTTTFSIGATIFLLRRKLGNWLYWIGIDLIYVGIYWSREAWFFALFMVIYTAIATWAYWNWRRLIKINSK
jgi:nicotinamide mononucleotide transporter